MRNTGLILLLLCLTLTEAKAQTEVQFYTTQGNFKVLLYDSIVPITAGNFLDLVNKKYYDGVLFHRVIDNFMIQGGDPTGTGSGGPGYTIDDEFDSTLSNVQKTLSMANRGPNTGGSQFFINLVNNTYLDYNKPPYTSKHPVFGIVTDSFEVVQRIGKVSTNIQNRPREDVVIDSIRVLYDRPQIEADLLVFPNPLTAASQLHYKPANGNDGGALEDLKVYDPQGKLCWSLAIDAHSNSSLISLLPLYDLHLSRGIYTVKFDERATRLVIL